MCVGFIWVLGCWLLALCLGILILLLVKICVWRGVVFWCFIVLASGCVLCVIIYSCVIYCCIKYIFCYSFIFSFFWFGLGIVGVVMLVYLCVVCLTLYFYAYADSVVFCYYNYVESAKTCHFIFLLFVCW